MSEGGAAPAENPLNLLLSAPSQPAVQRLFNTAFRYRHTKLSAESPVLSMIAGELGADETQTLKLMDALVELVLAAMYHGNVEDVADVLGGFPGELDARLKRLIGQILKASLAQWREAGALQRVSLPKLLETDWRVDLQSSSTHVLQMAVPSVLVRMRVQDQPTRAGEVPPERNVTFEMSKEALQTLLDGLGRIRDQLGAVSTPAADAST